MDIKGKKQTLYFKHWVDSGIITFNNLKVVNGVIDEHYLYETKNKQNIFQEISVEESIQILQIFV